MNSTGSDAVARALEEHRTAMESVEAAAGGIAKAAELIADAIGAGGQVLLCGNGGSAADAQHFAAELVGRYLKDRRAFPALALSTNPSVVTAIANDFGYADVFARQIEAHGRAGDVLVALSTSGGSENCLRAVVAARRAGMRVVTMTGGDGGALGSEGDVNLIVATPSTPRVQEGHGFMCHAICELVEERLCPTR
jgi:D-sedoheptulose 7-phosphate isomerase